MRPLLIACVIPGVLAARGRIARADSCPPTAVLAGDPSLVAAVGELLIERGIDVVSEISPTCAALQARIERTGEQISVHTTPADGGATIDREVTEPAAAATLIESWTRTDVTSPLLEAHHRAPAASLVSTSVVSRDSHLAVRRVQVFFALESSISEDREGWFGTMIGGCVMFGPVCAAIRGRFASTTPDLTGHHIERRAFDALFGGDVPIRVGTTTLSPGFAFGLGAVHSQEAGVGGALTFGLRADAHAVWSLHIWDRLSVDLTGTIDVTQVTDVEMSSGQLRDEPRFLARVGAGLRYGGL